MTGNNLFATLAGLIDKILVLEFLGGVLFVVLAAWISVRFIKPDKFLTIIWGTEVKANINTTGIIVFIYGAVFFANIPFGFMSMHFFLMPMLIVIANALEIKIKRYRKAITHVDHQETTYKFFDHKTNFLGMVIDLTIIYGLFFAVFIMTQPNYIHSPKLLLLIIMYLMHIIEVAIGLFYVLRFYKYYSTNVKEYRKGEHGEIIKIARRKKIQ